MKNIKNIREGNKRHLKYFNGGDDIRFIGTVMMAISGLLFLWTWYVWYSYVLYILMIILFPVGLALYIIGSLGRSTDDEIDGVISRLSSAADIDKEKDAELLRKQLSRPLPEIISGYDYSDGLMFRKSKKGAIRSEQFKKATLLPLNEGLYISCATVNIPCESVKKEIFELPYGDIEEIRVVSQRKTVRFSKKSFSVNDSRLEIISKGNIVLSLPAKESATLDSFVKDIEDLKTHSL